MIKIGGGGSASDNKNEAEELKMDNKEMYDAEDLKNNGKNNEENTEANETDDKTLNDEASGEGPDVSDESEGSTEEKPEETEDQEGKEPRERELKWAKKNKKDPEPDPLEEAEDKYKRLLAEFENFRTRTEKEKSERYEMGVKSVIEKILPIMDNFERGFSSVEESDKEDAFVVGMDMIYKQFEKTLEDLGVTPIEAVGKEFDPELHNAVMHVEDPEAGENIIVEEFQKGYMYKDKVVRYSMVKVAN